MNIIKILGMKVETLKELIKTSKNTKNKNAKSHLFLNLKLFLRISYTSKYLYHFYLSLCSSPLSVYAGMSAGVLIMHILLRCHIEEIS